MMNTIDFQSELDEEFLFNLGVDDLSASEFPTRPEDPLGYYQASHMLILNKLPADIPNHSYQTMDGLVPNVGGSAEVTIYGNESSQTSRHWEYMGNTRPIHPGQSSGVCPTPTSRPWPTSQAGDSFVVSTKSRDYDLPRVLTTSSLPEIRGWVVRLPSMRPLRANSLRLPAVTTSTATLPRTLDSSPGGSRRTGTGSELVRRPSLLSLTGSVDVSHSESQTSDGETNLVVA